MPAPTFRPFPSPFPLPLSFFVPSFPILSTLKKFCRQFPALTLQSNTISKIFYSHLFYFASSVVQYERIGLDRYNLAFGDWNQEHEKVDDSSRTNNDDRDKVLMTVAVTALDFTAQFPKAELLIVGSTPGRTRLYQMGIRNNLPEINRNFYIMGLYQQKWETFIHRRNYDAFLAQRK